MSKGFKATGGDESAEEAEQKENEAAVDDMELKEDANERKAFKKTQEAAMEKESKLEENQIMDAARAAGDAVTGKSGGKKESDDDDDDDDDDEESADEDEDEDGDEDEDEDEDEVGEEEGEGPAMAPTGAPEVVEDSDGPDDDDEKEGAADSATKTKAGDWMSADFGKDSATADASEAAASENAADLAHTNTPESTIAVDAHTDITGPLEGAAEGPKEGTVGEFMARDVKCGKCLPQFYKKGGCMALKTGKHDMFIPAGCMHCGVEAMEVQNQWL
jgi:hypothetical protein